MSTFKSIGWQFAKKTVSISGKAIAGTVNFAYGLTKAAYNKDANAAIDIIEKRIQRSVKGIQAISMESGKFIRDTGKNYLEGKDIMDEVNRERALNITSILAAGVLIGETGAAIFGDDNASNIVEAGTLESEGMVPDCDVDSIDGVHNGMLIDDTYLDDIIEQGKIEGTHHIDSDNYTRNIQARNEFLYQHGLTEVPEGYEVHHIVPLCEGGVDSADNMILLTKEAHHQVTAEHSQFYGWNK